MKSILRTAVLGAALALMAAPTFSQQNVKTEKSEHPRIARAIEQLEDAIKYMEEAPHDFGGHKAKAIADSRQAIVQLRKALEYRAVKDNKKH